MIIQSILTFLVSISFLLFGGALLVKSIIVITRFLGWREFIVAFLLVAFANTLPNFSVGISAALYGVPQLSLGDVVGGNIADLALGIAIVVLIAGKLVVKGKFIFDSVVFTVIVAILPLIMLLDGKISRIDGVLLIGVFVAYIGWIFSKRERFKEAYGGRIEGGMGKLSDFLKALGKTVVGIFFLIGGAWGVVSSASFIAKYMGIPVYLVGIFIIGIGNSIPEIYFAAISARRGRGGVVLGDLMGSVIMPSTLVLGVVSLIKPIEIFDPSSFVIARFFLLAVSLLFLIFVITGRRISKKEALFLFLFFFAFLLTEIIYQI